MSAGTTLGSNSSHYRRLLLYQIPILIGSLWSLSTHEIWPVLPLGFGVSLLLLVLDRYSFGERAIVSTAVLVGIWYRLTVVVATPSMIGYDPDSHAIAIIRINETGSLSAISELIYQNLPLFFTFHSATTTLTGVSSDISLNFVTALLYALIPVLLVATILGRISDTETVKLGSILASGCGIFLVYSTLPITQGFMTLLWFVFLGTLFDLDNDGIFGIAAVLLVLLPVAHKLGGLLPVVMLSSVTVFVSFQSWRRNEFAIPTRYVVLTGLAVIMLLIQSFVLTDFGTTILTRATQTATNTATPVGGLTDQSTTALVEPTGGILTILYEHISWLTLISMAGFSGMWLLYAHTDSDTAVILPVALVSFAFVLLAVTSAFSLAGIRARILGAPIFVVLTAIAVSKLVGNERRPPLGTFVVIVLLATQLGAAGATPDHPTENVKYLSEPEIDARDHVNRYVDETSYAPSYLSQETTNYTRPGATYITGDRATDEGWAKLDVYLLFDQLPEEGCIVWRKDQRYLRFTTLFRLVGDPTPIFAENRSRIYENRDVVVYC